MILNDKQIHSALRRIGLALNASHNVILTDDPDIEPNEKSWRTDHFQEIADLEYIKSIFINIDIYHGCECCNKIP